MTGTIMAMMTIMAIRTLSGEWSCMTSMMGGRYTATEMSQPDKTMVVVATIMALLHMEVLGLAAMIADQCPENHPHGRGMTGLGMLRGMMLTQINREMIVVVMVT